MPIAHLGSETPPDEVAAAVGRDGAVIVDGVAEASLLDRIEAELRPYLDATPTGPDDFSGDDAPGARARSSPARPRAASSSCTRWRSARLALSSGTPPTSSCT